MDSREPTPELAAQSPLTNESTGEHEEARIETRLAASLFFCGLALHLYTQNVEKVVYSMRMGRTNIVINDSLIRKARKLTRLRTKRQIVDRALDLLVRSESRKGILKYYGSGIWQGDLKASRRNRV